MPKLNLKDAGALSEPTGALVLTVDDYIFIIIIIIFFTRFSLLRFLESPKVLGARRVISAQVCFLRCMGKRKDKERNNKKNVAHGEKEMGI